LTPDQKYAICKSYYASPHFNSDQKKALKEKIFEEGKDNSDKGQKVKLLCDYSLPDAEQKERIWSSVTELTSTDSLQLAEIKMSGFF
jgi:hypothetical protein